MLSDELKKLREIAEQRKLDAKDKGYHTFLLKLWDDCSHYLVWRENGYADGVPASISNVLYDKDQRKAVITTKRNQTFEILWSEETERYGDDAHSYQFTISVHAPDECLEIIAVRDSIGFFSADGIEGYIPGLWEEEFNRLQQEDEDNKNKRNDDKDQAEAAKLKKKFGL